MKFVSSIGPVGLEEISSLGGSQLLLVHNELRTATGESVTKRFSDSKSGRERTARAFKTWASRQEEPPPPQVKATKIVRPQPAASPEPVRPAAAPAARPAAPSPPSGPGLMRLPARAEIRTHKPSTNRGKIITLGIREEGVSMQELVRITGWVPQQVRSCLRQINDYSGHGIEERTQDHFFITGTPKHRKPMSWPAKGEVRDHRPGTKRAKVVEMLTRPEGATFEDIKAACGWNDIQAYEGIKLIHGYLRYGIKEVDGIIRAFKKGDQK